MITLRDINCAICGKIVHNDELTNSQCLNHNIKLIRISTDNIKEPLSDEIKNIITMAILNQAVQD